MSKMVRMSETAALRFIAFVISQNYPEQVKLGTVKIHGVEQDAVFIEDKPSFEENYRGSSSDPFQFSGNDPEMVDVQLNPTNYSVFSWQDQKTANRGVNIYASDGEGCVAFIYYGERNGVLLEMSMFLESALEFSEFGKIYTKVTAGA